MQDNPKYADQCRKFCTYRYAFFKRSNAYLLVQAAIEATMKEYGQRGPLSDEAKAFFEIHRRTPGIAFNEDILLTAARTSPEAVRAVVLDFKYNTPWNGDGSWVLNGTTDDGEHIIKMGTGISVFDVPNLMDKKINIQVSIKEILTIDSSIESIKARIKKHFRENFPDALGIPEIMRKPDGSLKGGKFLPFGKWERCLDTYDKIDTGESRAALSKKIEKSGQAPGYYKDRSNATRKIKEELEEAKRLIESAANGTFPY